jgi:hypothetical protein
MFWIKRILDRKQNMWYYETAKEQERCARFSPLFSGGVQKRPRGIYTPGPFLL